MNYGIVLAAGKGTRFGKEKQLLLLKKKPLFYYSLKTFLNSSFIYQCVFVVPQGQGNYYQSLLKKHFKKLEQKKIILCEGGETRQESVKKGIHTLLLKNPFCEQDKVLIHDAARPFITQQAILTVLEELKNYLAVTLGYPMQDALKKAHKNGEVIKELNREAVWGISTPQGFCAKTLYSLLKENTAPFYDETALFTAKNIKVKIISCPFFNLKVTYPKDFEIIQKLF